MRKFFTFFLFFSIFSSVVFAGGGWATSVVNITANTKNGGSAYNYILNNEGWTDGNWGSNTAFNALDFGTPTSLVLNGGSGNGWTDDSPGYNSTSFIIYYRVYQTGGSAGSWSSINLTNQSHHVGNNYIFDLASANINVLALTSGTGNFTLEVVMSKNQYYNGGAGNWLSMVPGGQAVAYNSASAGYKATFNLDTPYPVELTSFTSQITSRGIQLNWQTATEKNNAGFEVQRSTDKNSWSAIGYKAGAGNTNTPRLYSFVDKSFQVGVNYYRLKQVDNDGTFDFSQVIEVAVGNPMRFELGQNYPNPFNPNTQISYTLPKASSVKLSLFNALGQEVRVLENTSKEAGYYTVNLNAADLGSGVYYYKLEAGNSSFMKKMIVLK